MADVIRAALDAHRLVLSTGRADPTRGNCSTWATCTGCGWTMNTPATQAMTAHITHQAEVATAAVLDVTELVLEGWLEQPQASRAMRAITAALAGEG